MGKHLTWHLILLSIGISLESRIRYSDFEPSIICDSQTYPSMPDTKIELTKTFFSLSFEESEKFTTDLSCIMVSICQNLEYFKIIGKSSLEKYKGDEEKIFLQTEKIVSEIFEYLDMNENSDRSFGKMFRDFNFDLKNLKKFSTESCKIKRKEMLKSVIDEFESCNLDYSAEFKMLNGCIKDFVNDDVFEYQSRYILVQLIESFRNIVKLFTIGMDYDKKDSFELESVAFFLNTILNFVVKEYKELLNFDFNNLFATILQFCSSFFKKESIGLDEDQFSEFFYNYLFANNVQVINRFQEMKNLIIQAERSKLSKDEIKIVRSIIIGEKKMNSETFEDFCLFICNEQNLSDIFKIVKENFLVYFSNIEKLYETNFNQ